MKEDTTKAVGAGSGPALSNFLAVQAHAVAGAVSRYKRSSLEAHRAYLEAGRLLVEARPECRRGQWGPFLAACGVSARVASNMMQLARAGATAEDVTERGGVQAALDALRAAAAGAVEAAGDALEVGGEKPESNSGFSGPALPDRDHDSGPLPELNSGFSREDVQRARADSRAVIASAAAAASGPPPTPEPEPEGRPTLRQQRRLVLLCADCGAWSGQAYRCPGCSAKRSEASARAASRRRFGAAVETRIRAAAARGRGVRVTLSAEEVRALVDGDSAAAFAAARRRLVK